MAEVRQAVVIGLGELHATASPATGMAINMPGSRGAQAFGDLDQRYGQRRDQRDLKRKAGARVPQCLHLGQEFGRGRGAVGHGVSKRLWRGHVNTDRWRPVAAADPAERLAARLFFLASGASANRLGVKVSICAKVNGSGERVGGIAHAGQVEALRRADRTAGGAVAGGERLAHAVGRPGA